MPNADPSDPFRNPYRDDPYQPARREDGGAPGAVVTAQLASLWQRLAGAIIDIVLGVLFVIPGAALMIAGAVLASENQGDVPETVGALFFIGIGAVFLGIVVMLVLQMVVLAMRSQTVGKYLMQTQIVDFDTGLPADFIHCVVLRILVNSLVGMVPCVGAMYGLVDVLFVFREDRRCIHDLLASTTVIDISNR